MVWVVPETLRDLPEDPARYKGAKGPVGSGKTVLCFPMDILHKACRQARSPIDGVRYSREVVIRSTEPRLMSTTIPTFTEWMRPELFGGSMRWDAPITYHARWAQAPGDIVDLVVWFIPAESAADAEKLKSLEVGRARINEATEVNYRVFTMLRSRINRYPKAEHGHCSEPGIIMDFNPPPPDHWLNKLIDNPPPGFRFWEQPPAVLEDPNGPLVSAEGTRYRVNVHGDPERGILPADNLAVHHPKGLGVTEDYYADQVNGAEDSDIRVLLMNKTGFLQDGVPVHKNFRDDWHYSKTDLPVYEGFPILTGWDFGGTPAVGFAQFSPKGQLRILAELCAEAFISFPNFVTEVVKPFVAQRFPWMMQQNMNRGWGDPAGRAGEGHEDTNFDELQKNGFNVIAAPDHQNLLSTRVKALDSFINRTVDGNMPALIVSRECSTLRAGLAGRYKIPKVVSGANEGSLRGQPAKTHESHICEALQYLALGIIGAPDKRVDQLKATVAAYNQGLRPMDRIAGY